MITPRFSCTQTDNSVVVNIYAPAIRASEIETHVEERLFSLNVNPYFLRLQFPAPIVDDEDSNAEYDGGSGWLKISLSKQNKGEDFPDLDFLSKLLAPLHPVHAEPPQIEVLDSETSAIEDLTRSLHIEDTELRDAINNDWQFPQTIPSNNSFRNSPTVFYGFLNRYTGLLRYSQQTGNRVNQLRNEAETLSPSERKIWRERLEDEKFNENHYIADICDEEEDYIVLQWQHPFLTSPMAFTEGENMALLQLPRREYLVSPYDRDLLYMILISILFSYAYESRFNSHDPSPESGCSIGILTPAFAALDVSASTLTEVFQASYRRALTYGYYRLWPFCERCKLDVAGFLVAGTRTVLKCLLEIKSIFDHDEAHYIYSKIWLDDFCVWVQCDSSDDILRDWGNRVRDLTLDKKCIGWDLDLLDLTAQIRKAQRPDSDDETNEVEMMTPSAL